MESSLEILPKKIRCVNRIYKIQRHAVIIVFPYQNNAPSLSLWFIGIRTIVSCTLQAPSFSSMPTSLGATSGTKPFARVTLRTEKRKETLTFSGRSRSSFQWLTGIYQLSRFWSQVLGFNVKLYLIWIQVTDTSMGKACRSRTPELFTSVSSTQPPCFTTLMCSLMAYQKSQPRKTKRITAANKLCHTMFQSAAVNPIWSSRWWTKSKFWSGKGRPSPMLAITKKQLAGFIVSGNTVEISTP